MCLAIQTIPVITALFPLNSSSSFPKYSFMHEPRELILFAATSHLYYYKSMTFLARSILINNNESHNVVILDHSSQNMHKPRLGRAK